MTTIRWEWRDGKWRAWFQGFPDKYGLGVTRAEAVWSMLETHGAVAGLKLKGPDPAVEASAQKVRDMAATAGVSVEEFARRFSGPEGDAAADAKRKRSV